MVAETEKLQKAAFILKTIAHPVRLRIIELLSENDELAVGEICERIGSEQSLTSHHLTNMKLKGLIASERRGKNMYYSLKEREVVKIIACIENCNCNMG